MKKIIFLKGIFYSYSSTWVETTQTPEHNESHKKGVKIALFTAIIKALKVS